MHIKAFITFQKYIDKICNNVQIILSSQYFSHTFGIHFQITRQVSLLRVKYACYRTLSSYDHPAPEWLGSAYTLCAVS